MNEDPELHTLLRLELSGRSRTLSKQYKLTMFFAAVILTPSLGGLIHTVLGSSSLALCMGIAFALVVGSMWFYASHTRELAEKKRSAQGVVPGPCLNHSQFELSGADLKKLKGYASDSERYRMSHEVSAYIVARSAERTSRLVGGIAIAGILLVAGSVILYSKSGSSMLSAFGPTTKSKYKPMPRILGTWEEEKADESGRIRRWVVTEQ